MNIVAAIEEQERLAMSYGRLQEDRAEAIDEYYGRPYGDELEGRSQVVMRDVHDTIEWIKPSLMKVFASGDEVASFTPVGEEDEEQAQQETDYVNHVLTQKNNGFLIFHDWFHDALLQKTGYVLVTFEEERRPEREQFRGLSEDEFALLMQGEVEVLEHASDGMTHDVVVRTIKNYGCVKVKNIPPERVLVAPDWPEMSLQDCPFVCVINWESISDLRQAGYQVEDTINDSSAYNEDRWEEQRREVTFDGTPDREGIEADPATRRVRVRRIWMRFDEDGDGIAELRRVVVVGATVLENEEDDLVPIAAITPQRVPHEHYGISIADNVRDLQRIRTVLVRGFLDNMYLANNGRFAVDTTRVNLDDMLVSRPGGVVRTSGDPAGAIMPLLQPHQGGDILSAVEYIDSVRENRTGVTKYNQGLDANSLNKTALGVTQIMSAAQQRIEMIARIFAETGVKNLMLIVHAMSMKHGRQAEMVKLRNQWVPVDPRTWKSRRDMTIAVGIGTGNKDQMLGHLQMILQAQQMGLAIGIVTPKNVYHAMTKLTQNAGFKQPEQFWTEPPEGPLPPPPNPEEAKAQVQMQLEQMRLQADQQKFQAEAQLRLAEIQAQTEAKLTELRANLELQAHNDDRDAERERLTAEMQAQIQLAKQQSDEAIAQAKLELERYKADLDAQVKLHVAEKQAEQADMKGVEQTLGALLEEIKTPKEVVRDASGKAIGVRQGNKVRNVKRDGAGKVVGVE